MAICLSCEAEIEERDIEIGDLVTCAECGAEMEVVSVTPLVLELFEEEDDEDLDETDDDDEEEEDGDDDL